MSCSKDKCIVCMADNLQHNPALDMLVSASIQVGGEEVAQTKDFKKDFVLCAAFDYGTRTPKAEDRLCDTHTSLLQIVRMISGR
jgi:hypothetical protein